MESNIINNIILEWAMESPDGLLSGFNSATNITCLKEILLKKSISNDLCEEIISEILATEKMSPEEKETKRQEKLAASAAKKDAKIAAKQAAKDAKAAEEKTRLDAINPNEVSIDSLSELKNLSKYAKGILDVVEKYPEFKAQYNRLSIAEAIDFLNESKNLATINDLNTVTGQTLGEGELPLVFLVKGGKSGGTKSGDLVAEGKNVDVKKLGDWGFRVELASFSSFSSTEFSAAASELIHFAAEKKNAEVLKKLVDNVDDKLISTTNYAKKFKETTKRFLSTPDIELFRRGTVMGLAGIGMHLESLDTGKPASDYADFVIDQDKTTVNVDNAKEIERTVKQQSEKGPDAQPRTVSVKLSPIDDEESQLIIPKIKRLKYFTERFGPQNIATDVLPRLHYTDIIFYNPQYSSGKVKLFSMMTKEQVVNSFEFYGWQKAPVFRMHAHLRSGGSENSGETELNIT